jgi:superfamily I DNA and/or RNA helicase
MDRCRPSVPVWIMPIYRIAEQVRVQPNLYDVVIVDEASQAGLEASFLQYLAPKIVVIGDDKQVSPSAVGVDQQQLRDLANMYLATDPYRASWLDPKRSYFDEANMRFGGRITLTEHRRCVPEIIGFSNRVAYEPEGIRLVPVRQFGAERLDPIKVVHLAEGYEADNKTNPVEADAIVDQIRKCLAEPQYDGATFGVISLLGKEQAKLIEYKLLDAVPPGGVVGARAVVVTRRTSRVRSAT